MIFKKKKKRDKHIANYMIDEEEEKFLNRFQNIEAPILFLDERWMTMFPNSEKSKEVQQIEKELKEAFVYQAKLSEDLKVAEETKKKLMDRIIKNMRVAQISEEEAMLQDKSQEFIREINDRITELEMEYEVMPQRIKNLNENLLRESMRYCYRKMKVNQENLQKQDELIKEAKALLEQRKAKKKEMQRQMESMYVFMHRIFGREVLQMLADFDDFEED